MDIISEFLDRIALFFRVKREMLILKYVLKRLKNGDSGSKTCPMNHFLWDCHWTWSCENCEREILDRTGYWNIKCPCQYPELSNYVIVGIVEELIEELK